MANPNIVNVLSIYGKTTFLTPAVTTNVVLLANATGSANSIKVNNILVANVDGTSAISATVALYTNGSVAQGSAPTGGTAYPLIYQVSVPAGSTISILDKTIYLEENVSLIVTSGTASKLTYTVSYEAIS
jgi:hypothetical protein